jgi:DNA-binding GntR family transcriptional regulator
VNDPRKWVQVAQSLRAKIDAGELKPGTRVSITIESRTRDVSKRTVTRAVQELVTEGRLLRFPGHSYIVADTSAPGSSG